MCGNVSSINKEITNMCEFFSCIATRDGHLYFTEHDSHETIISRLKLRDTAHTQHFVRLEILPPFDTCTIDQRDTPSWFDEDKVAIMDRAILLAQQVALIRAEYDKVVDPARAEYDKVVDAARAEYRKVVDPARAEYRKVVDPARAEYRKVVDAAEAEYDKVVDAAEAEYRKVVDAAEAEYDKVVDAARAEYDKVVDPARAEYLIKISTVTGFVAT